MQPNHTRIPFDDNRKPFLTALSALGDGSAVSLKADPATGALLNVSMGSLITELYDYISVAYPINTTEVYTFKTGGSGGTTVATITVVYTDSTKINLNTVTRS
jgi:hypothetical protein